MTTHATGTAVIDAPLTTIRDTLLAAPELPEWNPAFRCVTGPARATLDAAYELEAIRGMRGTLTYPEIQEHRIVLSWHVPMLSEHGAWELEERGPGCTVVTHTVQRQGPLAIMLGPTLATLPTLRLDRLVERATSPQPRRA